MLIGGGIEMKIAELIGKRVTDIFQVLDLEVGGLDKGDCYIELDNELVVGIPYAPDDDVWIKEVPFEADSVFKDLSDIPIYDVKSLLGIKYTKLSHFKENTIKYLKDQRIVDFLWFDDDDDNFRFSSQGYFLLENGYIITQTLVAPHGLGLAGLNYYYSIANFEEQVGKKYKRLTER